MKRRLTREKREAATEKRKAATVAGVARLKPRELEQLMAVARRCAGGAANRWGLNQADREDLEQEAALVGLLCLGVYRRLRGPLVHYLRRAMKCQLNKAARAQVVPVSIRSASSEHARDACERYRRAPLEHALDVASGATPADEAVESGELAAAVRCRLAQLALEDPDLALAWEVHGLGVARSDLGAAMGIEGSGHKRSGHVQWRDHQALERLRADQRLQELAGPC